MSVVEYKAPYALTDREVQVGMKLACAPLYAGGWRVAVIVYALVQGIALGVAFVALSFVLARMVGDVPGSAGYLMYLLFAIFGLAYWVLERRIKRRSTLVYLDCLLMKDQNLHLTEDGIAFMNGRSRSFFHWSDIENLVETGEMIVATFGYQGVAMPNRILAKAGDPEEIRMAIKNWHVAAETAA
jgi:hypothetical protein